jgi:hypothetical protein
MAKFYAGISLPNKNKILSFEPIVVDINRISEIIPYYDFYIRDSYAKEIIKLPTSKIIIPHRGIKNGIHILMGSPTDIYYDMYNADPPTNMDKIPDVLEEVNRMLKINIERYYKPNFSIYDLGYSVDLTKSTNTYIHFIQKI